MNKSIIFSVPFCVRCMKASSGKTKASSSMTLASDGGMTSAQIIDFLDRQHNELDEESAESF